MGYEPKTWVSGEKIYAVDLNHMELGIEAASKVGTERQVIGFVDGVQHPVTIGVPHLTDIGGFPSFANGVLTATAMNSANQTGLLSFMEFSTTTAKAGTFPTYGTSGVLVVGTATANNHAVTKAQLDAKPSIGTTATTAKAGNYTPSVADIPALPTSKITSGVFAIAQIPTGTTSTTVKLGNYTPSATEIVTAINAMTPEQVIEVQTKLGITP